MKLVILDRDGVINHDSPDYIKSPREWWPIQGSLEAIVRLNQAGYRVVVATNQAGIGRGLFDYDDLFAIHDKMNRMLAELGGRLDGIFFCPHAPAANCDCRKPRPGLLLQVAQRFQADLQYCVFVGDSDRDIQAAFAAGARPVLVCTGNGARTLEENPELKSQASVYKDLSDFVTCFL